MGSTGRASRNMVGYTTPTPIPTPTPQPQQPQPNNVAQQAPNVQNTPVVPGALNALTQMSDDQMETLIKSAINIKMPNMLNDVGDATQSFVFAAGLNEKPMVLDAQAFNQYMKDNNIPQSQILSRSVDPITYKNASGTQVKLSADQVIGIMQNSRLNYIGGKHGGQALGAGAYFDMNGGRNTGYGQTTVNAVLNPNTARIIDRGDIQSKWINFTKSHPKAASAVNSLENSFRYKGSSNVRAVQALLMGYNVINRKNGGSTYHNIIDRSALVYKK